MSILLAGTSTSNLTVPANNLVIGTSAFTVEWWQFQTDSNSWPRVFAVGTTPSTQIGVSIESSIFYFWRGSTPINFGNVSPYKNAWVHFAVARDASNNLRVFKNGTQVGSTQTSITNNFTQSLAFTIGNETTTSANASFGGNITNFRLVIGSAVYTSNFTPPTTPLTAIAGTALLLLASSSGTVATDSSSSPKTVTANNITWSSSTPIVRPTPNLWTSPTQFSTKNLQVVNTATINGQQLIQVDSSDSFLSSSTVLNVTVDTYTTSSSINSATPLIRTFNLIKYYNTSKIFIDAWLNVRKAPGDTNWPTYLRCDLKSVGNLITYGSRTVLFFIEPRDHASSIANVKFYFDTTTRTAPAGQYVVEFYAGRANNTANTVVFLINSTTYSAGAPTNPASTFVYYEIE